MRFSFHWKNGKSINLNSLWRVVCAISLFVLRNLILKRYGFVMNAEKNGNHYKINEISYSIAKDFLLKNHYLSQQGNGFMCSVAHGLFDNKLHLIGVIVYSGISVIETLIGAFEGYDRDSDQSGIYELSRLAMDDKRKERNLTSWFVARSIRLLRKNYDVRAIISYADSAYHHGFIYQATNWDYYGLSAPKSDFFEQLEDGTERQVWRGAVKDLNGRWIERSRKHRYMLVFDKTLKVKWRKQPYPKGNNNEYALKIPDEVQLDVFDLL